MSFFFNRLENGDELCCMTSYRPEQYAVMQNNTRFIEGCFCPNGTMRHSEAVDICVPNCGKECVILYFSN